MRGVQHRTGCTQPALWVSTFSVNGGVIHTCPECGRSAAYDQPDDDQETADEGWWDQ